MQFTGVRKSSVCEPEFLIEVLRVDDVHIAFPMAQPAPVISWEVFVVFFQRTSVVINHAPIVIAAPDKYDDALLLAIFQKLNPIRKLKLPRAAGRHAV